MQLHDKRAGVTLFMEDFSRATIPASVIEDLQVEDITTSVLMVDGEMLEVRVSSRAALAFSCSPLHRVGYAKDVGNKTYQMSIELIKILSHRDIVAIGFGKGSTIYLPWKEGANPTVNYALKSTTVGDITTLEFED